MPVQDIQKYEKACREYRIIFNEELGQSEPPARHRHIWNALQSLGDTKYTTYLNNAKPEERWKLELKKSALTINEQARRCVNRNEWNWRFAVEPLLFSRISSEVCCQKCRKRLWRSEIEATRQDATEGAARLESRQKAREPCRCERFNRSQDLLEASGLNQIFTYRIDEEVHHSQDVTKMIGKSEKPDRIFGLRQTRNIENLLYDEAKGGLQDLHGQVAKQVHELVELDRPLALTGDRLLFPFLVLEAKSSNAADSWHSIQLQTAFSIRSFLEAQERLRKAANIPSSYQQGSVVWFMANKGEDWRLSICYPESAPVTPGIIGTTIYRVTTVWRGSICSRDGALQALLLVDFIFDWARDIYRNDIIRHLRVLATGNNDAATNTHADTDMLSIFPTSYLTNQDSLNEEPEEDVLTREEFLVLDGYDGLIRHATFVELRYFCLVITKDNIQTFLQSIPPTKVQRICRRILQILKENIQINAADLDAMGENWTGAEYITRNPFNIQPKFHTAISLATYISSRWHIVRDLSVIALAKDAWDGIVHASGLRPNRGKASKPRVYVGIDSATLLSSLERLKAGSPRQVLLSAIERHYIRLEGCLFRGQVRYIPDQDSSLWTLTHFMYSTFKTGALEPQEPFLRVSKIIKQQHRQISDMIPVWDREAVVSAEGCILIHGTCDPSDREGSKGQVCAYLTQGNGQLLERSRLGYIVKQAFETRDFYHTFRNHGGPARSPLASSSVDEEWRWNLTNTYGVFSIGDFRFLRFIRRLRAEKPITQGSSRVEGSGTQLFTRNFSPWINPRYTWPDRAQRMFVLYKLFSREISFWRSTAREKRAAGLSCCQCCATLGQDDICSVCMDVLEDENRYTWMKDCLLGISPFTLTELDASSLIKRLPGSLNQSPSLRECIWAGPLDGPTNDDEDWAWNLDSYTPLETPFNDIAQLAAQWRKYCIFRRKHNWLSLGKRKRSPGIFDDQRPILSHRGASDSNSMHGNALGSNPVRVVIELSDDSDSEELAIGNPAE